MAFRTHQSLGAMPALRKISRRFRARNWPVRPAATRATAVSSVATVGGTGSNVRNNRDLATVNHAIARVPMNREKPYPTEVFWLFKPCRRRHGF